MAELDVEKVKEKQRKKHYEQPNPIVDEQTNDKDGNKREQDVEKEEYIEGDSYPFKEESAKRKKNAGKDPKNLPWENESQDE